jgi:hypothetical protein
MLIYYILLSALIAKFICFYFIVNPIYKNQTIPNMLYAGLMLLTSFLAYFLYSVTMQVIFALLQPPYKNITLSNILIIITSIILISLYEFLLFSCFWKMALLKKRFIWNILINTAVVGFFAMHPVLFQLFIDAGVLLTGLAVRTLFFTRELI